MHVSNIEWDVDFKNVEEMEDILTGLDDKKVAAALRIPLKEYRKMPMEERVGEAIWQLRHEPALVNDFYGLPDDVDVPEEIETIEDVADWLSDTYGFCHRGFTIN